MRHCCCLKTEKTFLSTASSSKPPRSNLFRLSKSANKSGSIDLNKFPDKSRSCKLNRPFSAPLGMLWIRFECRMSERKAARREKLSTDNSWIILFLKFKYFNLKLKLELTSLENPSIVLILLKMISRLSKFSKSSSGGHFSRQFLLKSRFVNFDTHLNDPGSMCEIEFPLKSIFVQFGIYWKVSTLISFKPLKRLIVNLSRALRLLKILGTISVLFASLYNQF